MRPILRRIRGVVTLGLLSAVAWGMVGALLTAITAVVDPTSVYPGEGVARMALVFGGAGFVAGAAAAVVLALAEHGRGIPELSLPRVALWGALGALAVPWIAGASTALIPIFAVMGGGSALVAVVVARRGERVDGAIATAVSAISKCASTSAMVPWSR